MNKTTKIILCVLAGISIFAGIGFLFRGQLERWFFRPTATDIPAGITQVDETKIATLAEGLTVPWDVAFVPGSSDVLITERPGTLKRIGESRAVYTVQGVEHTGEGGLMGMALHPQFATNHYIYLYYTTNASGALANTIERYTLTNDTLTDKKIIIKDIPAAANHDGGRLAFGPDGFLYITTGDAANTSFPQDTQSVAGKILRVTDEGAIPGDNPFGNAVYSYGHRNPQGLAWDDKGQLWATEHGPSGTPRTGCDELNLIKKGANYGWPIIMCDETKAGMVSPVAQSGTGETWAPAGIAYSDGSLFFTGLRGQSLYQAKIQPDNTVALTAHFRETYGRLRALTKHNDSLFMSTSNTDGRGTPKTGDDKVIRVPLDMF